MERQPGQNGGRFRSQFDLHFSGRSLNGLRNPVDLGRKREALQSARRRLRDPIMTAEAFNDALKAILTHSGKLESWTQLVESAYERLPKRERPSARFFVMSFRSGHHDHE